MLELAGEKVGDAARLAVADMRSLPDFGEFDLVWCLDDAINYLFDKEQLDSTLAGMKRNLAPGGLVVFDVNTLKVYRTFFAEEFDFEGGGKRLIWSGRGTPEHPAGALAEASFRAEPLGSEGQQIEPTVHRQRHFPEKEILAALSHVGLECLDVFGHDDDAVFEQPLDELRHTKAIYIASSATP